MFNQPFFIPAIVIVVLTLPLILGLIPPNRIYGIRTVETLVDKQRWYQANRYGGWTLLVSSLIYLGVAAFFPSVLAGETDPGRWIIHLGAFAGPLIISLVLIRRYVKRPLA
ncbi:MAG TPA: SdpI family protein [Anaerolineales bacterium]|nr:SdpI family protein [Anaerolineales bacterium]